MTSIRMVARACHVVLVVAVGGWAALGQAQVMLYQGGSFNATAPDSQAYIKKFDLLSSYNTQINGVGGNFAEFASATTVKTVVSVVNNTAGDVFAYAYSDPAPNLPRIYRYNAAGTITGSSQIAGIPSDAALFAGLGYNQANNWLYTTNINAGGDLYRLDATTMTVLNQFDADAAFAPAVNDRTGTVIAFTNSRTSPVFRNFSADLTKSATIALSGTTFTNVSSAGLTWAGRDAVFISDFIAAKTYRFTLGGMNADGLFTTGTLDASFGTNGAVSLSQFSWSVATDGQYLYVGQYRGSDFVSKFSLDGKTLIKSAFLNTNTAGSEAQARQIYVFTGNGTGVWSGTGGGSWGTLANTGTLGNWTALGGVPGINQLYTYDDTATFGEALAASGTVTLDGAVPKLGGMTFANASASYTIATGTGSGGIALVAGSAAGSGTAAVTVTAGSHAISAPITLASHGLFTVDGEGDALTISGLVSGSAGRGLTKAGAGRLTLSGSHSYSGATTVAAGLLAVNGTLGSGGVTVASGGRLGGDITAGGTTTIQSGGVLAVGNSPGTGSFSSLVLGGTTEMEFLSAASRTSPGTDFDTILVSTALTYGGTLDLIFAGGVTGDPATAFDLFDFGSVTPTGTFDAVRLFAGASQIASLSNSGGVWTTTADLGYGGGPQTFTFTQATGDFMVAAVPEPGALALAGIGIAAAAWAARRRRPAAR